MWRRCVEAPEMNDARDRGTGGEEFIETLGERQVDLAVGLAGVGEVVLLD
jgi:hypothetical protein